MEARDNRIYRWASGPLRREKESLNCKDRRAKCVDAEKRAQRDEVVAVEPVEGEKDERVGAEASVDERDDKSASLWHQISARA